MLTQRRLTPELMEDPGIDRDDLARSLGFIRAVNRHLGGTRAALGHLRRWSAGWPRDAPIRILDVGTGSADIPAAILRWAGRTGRRVHVTAVDRHETTLALAREHVGECGGLELVCHDALRLPDRFEPGRFDYAHAGMFLHHLQDGEVITMLRIMDRLTTRGIIWNDLIRGALERLVVRLLVVGRPPIVRHDAIASVAAGFIRREALDLAARAGLANVACRRHPFGRFTLTSTK